MAARAYGVIGLGARAAKIKQVCSVTTRGGEREGERGRETAWRERRETEGGRGPAVELLSGPKTIGGGLLPCSHARSKNSWKWRREEEEKKNEWGDGERESAGKGRQREGIKKRDKKQGERRKEAESWSFKQKAVIRLAAALAVTSGNDRSSVELS